MKRLFGSLARWLWYLAAAAVVLCAVLVSLGQYYFPYLDQYRTELVARAAERLPFGIEVAGLHAEWTGLAPTFRVQGLRLYAREEPAITILSSSRSDLRIDIVRSLLARAPRIRSITADDVQLGFREDAEGHWHLAGIGVSRTPANRDAILDFFLAIEEIGLERARIVLSPANGGQIETQNATVRMQNYRRLRRLDARLRDDSGGGRLDLIVETHGDPRQSGEFDASAWVRLQDARLARLQPLAGAALRLPRTALSGEVWASLDADGAWSVRGDVRTPLIELAPLASGRSLEPVRGLDTRFALRHAEGSTTLSIDHLAASWYAQDLDIRRLMFERRNVPGGTDDALAAEYLEVGALAGIATGSELVTGQWADALSDLSPYGGLANAHVDIRRRDGQPLQFGLRGRLEDLSVSPWRSAPGVRNARGYVELDRSGGFVDLDTQAVTLEFPRLYEEDLDFSALRGRVRWTRNEEGLVVDSEHVALSQEQSSFNARFGLQLNRDPAVEDEFNLAASVRNADVSLHEKLVPYGVNKGLRNWLANAVKAGRVDAGSFAYRGAFGRPDGSRSSSVQLALEVSEAAVDYHPDWPPASGLRARVAVDGSRARVQADQGEVLGARLHEALVDVDMAASARRLRVGGRVEADLGQVLALVNGSPLAAITKGALREWRGSGPTSVDLDLDLPLGQRMTAANARIGVHALLSGGTLQLGGLGLELAQLAGPLDYSLDAGLRSAGLSGTLWERPVTGKIGPLENAPGKMLIEAEGVAGAPEVERWLGVSTGGMLAGEAPFSLRLEQGDAGFTTRVRSHLAGISSALPEPLAKEAAAVLPFSLDWEPGSGGARIGATLEGVGSLALLRAPGAPPAGEILLGKGAPPALGAQGLSLRGEVEHADAGAWVVAVSRLVSLNPGMGGEGGGFRLDGLRAVSARLLRPDLSGLELRSRREENAFVIGFGSDLLAGEFRIPADRAEPYGLRFDRLELSPFLPPKPAADDAATAEGEAPEAPVDPGPDPWNVLAEARVPPIDVSIASLRNGPRDMGSWAFRIASETDALAISAATATLPGLRVSGAGEAPGASVRLRWIAGVPRTELSAGLRFDNPGEFFRNWGYDPVLEGNNGRADVSLSWPGNPLALRMADARGLLDFAFADGRLLRGGGNNPLMRAFGVLRFDELLRRLKLDFKDLYQSGLAFDSFEAVIDVADGIARTSEPMQLRGPTARMRLSGQSDLKRNLIDADLVVSLPLGSNLPWMAALAGGLPAVAGAYLASRIFEDQLGKFSSAVYTVTGPFEEPELKLVKVFDAEPAPPDANPDGAASTGSAAAPTLTPAVDAAASSPGADPR